MTEYIKSNIEEEINIGDLIMIDPNTAKVTKAVACNEESILNNSRLIIGVCVESNNNLPSDLDTEDPRLKIQVESQGEVKINLSGYADIGDKLSISEDAGKAKSKDYLSKEYFNTRSIGKLIKFTDNPNQGIILLDIE